MGKRVRRKRRIGRIMAAVILLLVLSAAVSAAVRNAEIRKLETGGYPKQLVELAKRNRETCRFVKNYYRYRHTKFTIDLQGEVQKGEICVLLGPSGSGKSTLLNIIGGIDDADSGYVSINDEKTKDMKESELTKYRRKHLGYVFQMYNLIPNLNVKENIEVGAYLSDSPLDIDELLNTLGLSEHKYKLPNQLSGGQQQRTAIGRAIVKNPDILLCDEPTGALDYHTSKEILKLIEDVNKKYGNTVIMVTHNDAIQNMADRVIKLRDGEIMDNIVNKNKIQAASLEW